MIEYKASLDKLAWIITIGVTALFIGLNGFSVYNFYQHANELSIAPGILTFLITIVIYFGCYLLHPVKYVVTNDMIIVKRLATDKRIHRSEIKDAFVVKKGNLGWTIRTFGVGGLFGYFGSFRTAAFGPMTWYATQRDNNLVIETKSGKKILLTPDDTTW